MKTYPCRIKRCNPKCRQRVVIKTMPDGRRVAFHIRDYLRWLLSQLRP